MGNALDERNPWTGPLLPGPPLATSYLHVTFSKSRAFFASGMVLAVSGTELRILSALRRASSSSVPRRRTYAARTRYRRYRTGPRRSFPFRRRRVWRRRRF